MQVKTFTPVAGSLTHRVSANFCGKMCLEAARAPIKINTLYTYMHERRIIYQTKASLYARAPEAVVVAEYDRQVC